MKALGIAAAAAVAFAPFSVVATLPGVAQAAPCAGVGADPMRCHYCETLMETYHTPAARVCYDDDSYYRRGGQAPPSRVPVPTTEAPPEPAPPSLTPVQTLQVVPPSPPPPSTIPVQNPKINPLAPGASRNASPVAPPEGLDASPQAVAAAKAAPATRVNPGIHQMLQLVDFNHQVQTVVNAHSGNVDVVKADNQALPRPRHWDYIDYDAYHRPTLYNPLNQAMTFRFFYNGAYQEAYVPAGGRIVLDVATVGLFPFTAVGDSYVASGSFSGGAWIPPPDGWDGPPPPDYTPPTPAEVYQDVSAYVPADDQTVQVGQVEVVGHDDSQPAGSQDTFLLDDSTLAWGQVNDASSSAQIRVTKTQSLPGVGPTDNGSFLAALTAYKEPTEPIQPWWPRTLGYGVLAIAVGFVAWMISRVNGARI
ncbi:MAG: hypothetical protein J2P16_07005 [Mycobacterium sp.]|nr:hypothetical protein [Mycobacterium sp.]